MTIPSRRLRVSNDLTIKPKHKFYLQDLDNLQAHVNHQAPNLIVLVGLMLCMQWDTTDHHSHSTYKQTNNFHLWDDLCWIAIQMFLEVLSTFEKEIVNQPTSLMKQLIIAWTVQLSINCFIKLMIIKKPTFYSSWKVFFQCLIFALWRKIK